MVAFLLRKIGKNKWMILALLVGNILLVGIVSATPLYTAATMQRILQQDFRQFQRENDAFPAVLSFRYLFNAVTPEHQMTVYDNTRELYWPEITRSFDIPPLLDMRFYSMNGWETVPYVARENRPRIRRLHFVAPEGIGEYIRMTHGQLPANVATGNVIEVIVTEAASVRHGLLMGELLEVLNVDEPDGPLFLRVVGFYERLEGAEVFWSLAPFDPMNTMIGDIHVIRERLIGSYIIDYNIRAEWLRLLDASAIRARNAAHYTEASEHLSSRFNTSGWVWRFDEGFTSVIGSHQDRVGQISLLLWILQIPVYILLAFYIHMVSRRIILLEQNDIAVIKSRGASRRQIILIYVLQGLWVGAVSFPLGLLLGVAICQLIGASNGFLDLVAREALLVEMTGTALFYSALAVGLSFLTMIIPVIDSTQTGIVEQKRRTSGKPQKALWQRYFLDILCLGLAGYSLYTFGTDGIRTSDPLLFVGASLFIIGTGFFALRCYPYFVRLIFLLGRGLWPPTLFASLLKIIRGNGEEQAVMIFLIFTVSVGLFGSQAARSINMNSDHHIRYLAGSDLMFRERWSYNVISEPAGIGDVLKVVYAEPDFNRFTHFPEVDALTPVMREAAMIRTRDSTVNGVQLMGIDSYSFGQAAWFRDDLLPVHENHFLNALALRPNGVLLSDNFRTRLGYQLSDAITVHGASGNHFRGVVAGFVEHWPGFDPSCPEGENFLAVANIGYLQQAWGVTPYQVWMRTQGASNTFFHDFLEENPLRLEEFYDTKAAITLNRSDPILQGINGVLTVGFIVTLLICFTGFLIYWMLSIRSRVLQFGIFRAMGMSMKEIVRLLVYEQLSVTLVAVFIGAFVGEISARLFIPLIQESFLESPLPLLVARNMWDYVHLFAVIGGIIVVCLLILGIFVARIKIDQALKLGED
jgi:putative ABC transport system permease protein